MNRFRVIKKLGDGSEGVVFAVEDQNDLDEIKEKYALVRKIRFVFVSKLFEFEFLLRIPILREIVSYNESGPRKISDLSQNWFQNFTSLGFNIRENFLILVRGSPPPPEKGKK